MTPTDDPAPTTRSRPGLTVLQSVPNPRPTTNPYVVKLMAGLAASTDVTVLPFSWRAALRGRYDAVHAHWPETLLGGRDPVRRTVQRALFLAFLIRVRLRRTAWVRTVHNLELPSGLGRVDRALLRGAERLTALRIVLNETTADPTDPVIHLIPHPHYRQVYGGLPPSEPVAGRVGFVGLVRRYKQVDELITAFREIEARGELTLRVAGAASTPELAADLQSLASGDRRIGFELRHLADAELVAEITAAELLVFPSRLMHNSGAVLAALSLDRPVLVVDNPVNRALRDEVGPGWVHTFTGRVHGADIAAAIDQRPRTPHPDLSRREWPVAVAQHVEAYRAAVALCH